MKKSLLFLLVLILSTTGYSQKMIFTIGPELAIPGSSYSLKMNAGTGVGGSLRFESFLGNYISCIATVGYIGFAKQELPYSGTPPTITTVKAIPIQAGLKYYFKAVKETPKSFFASAELGFMPITTHFDYAVNQDRDFKESGLSTALGIGYQLGNLEASTRLQYNLTASGFNVYYYNFRIAYGILKSKAANKKNQ